MTKKIFIFFTLFNLVILNPVFADKKALLNQNIILKDGDLTITTDEVELMLQDMSRVQKIRMLSNKERFKNLIHEALILKIRAKEAKERNIHKKNLVKWKVDTAKNQVLVQEMMKDFESEIQIPQSIEGIAKEIYDASPEDFQSEEQLKAAHILILVKKENTPEEKENKRLKIQNILKEIKDGLDFAEAAKKYSDDLGSGSKGGVLDYFTRGKMVPAFEEAVFALKNMKQISEIIETQFGFHIIKLLDKKEAGLIPFSEVKKELIQKEKAKYIERETEEFLKKLSISNSTNFYLPAFDNLFNNQTTNLEKLIKIK